MKRTDSLIREMILPADPSTVWEKSFGTPAALASWFPQSIEGDFVVGQPFTKVWGEHRSECRLVAIEPPHLLSYQWHPGDAYRLEDLPEEELTTIRFELSAHPEGTLVRMEESGFENIPKPRRGNALGENSNGWDEELQKLVNAYR